MIRTFNNTTGHFLLCQNYQGTIHICEVLSHIIPKHNPNAKDIEQLSLFQNYPDAKHQVVHHIMPSDNPNNREIKQQYWTLYYIKIIQTLDKSTNRYYLTLCPAPLQFTLSTRQNDKGIEQQYYWSLLCQNYPHNGQIHKALSHIMSSANPMIMALDNTTGYHLFHYAQYPTRHFSY